jgi:hypothetical protein
MKTKYRNLAIFTNFFNHFFLVIENLQNHIIFEFWISLFDEILPIKKGLYEETLGYTSTNKC